MAATDGMKMPMETARKFAERGFLTFETNSFGSGWAYARIMYGTDAVWSCPGHSHKTAVNALECATRQYKRIKKAS